MDFSIASILLLDGLTNGAVYALLGLATVLVFTVTRVIFIPQGEFVAYGALTLAIFQTGRVPGTVWLLMLLATVAALMELSGRWQHHRNALVAFKAAGRMLVVPMVVAGVAIWAAPQQFPLAVQAALSVAVVTVYGPLVYRVAYQSLESATPLVLLIVSVGVHFAMTGLGLVFFGAEGFRNPAFWDLRLNIGPVMLSGQAIITALATIALIVLLWLYFERSLRGKALRATAVNQTPFTSQLLTQAADLHHGRVHRRPLRPAHRTHHHRVLRLRFPHRAERLCGCCGGGSGQLPGCADRCVVCGRDRGLRFFLGQRIQGSDRVHADPAGALDPLPAQWPFGRGPLK